MLQHPHFATAETDFRLFVINDSAGTYLRRYWARGDLNDLSAAIKSWETVVATTPPDSPDLPGRLNNLGTGLTDRYARLGDLKDLQAGIAAYQQAVATTPPDSPDLPALLNNLGVGLSNRYARLGDLSDLQTGIEFFQQAMDSTLPDLIKIIINHITSNGRVHRVHW